MLTGFMRLTVNGALIPMILTLTIYPTAKLDIPDILT